MQNGLTNLSDHRPGDRRSKEEDESSRRSDSSTMTFLKAGCYRARSIRDDGDFPRYEVHLVQRMSADSIVVARSSPAQKSLSGHVGNDISWF
jgi:hypothetical protein